MMVSLRKYPYPYQAMLAICSDLDEAACYLNPHEQTLLGHGVVLEVWVDHAQAPTNLDPDIMQGHGAIVAYGAFHCDLTAQSANKVLRHTKLHDGTPVLEFMRCNPSWAGVSVLNTLVANQGCSIFYSHLGKVFSGPEPFQQQTRRAFELLAKFSRKKSILVTTTRRLLGCCRTVDDLNGLTWYVAQPQRVRLFINDQIYPQLIPNPPDASGRASVSIPWPDLNFPDL